MRRDKDRSGKWLLTHHGDAILKLGGITGFSSWKAVQPETVAPRRLPDGLFEVRFPGEADPTLVLVEIETYPDADADRQVLDGLMLIAVDRKAVPEVVSLVLKPKGNLTVSGSAALTSPRGRTNIAGSWPVVRLWEVDAETLFAEGDVGLIPWVPLTRTTQTPDELMARCRDRIEAVPDPNDREGLAAVTVILAQSVFDRSFLGLFGKNLMSLEAVLAEGAKALAEDLIRARALRESVLAALEARFGSVPADRVAPLSSIYDTVRLRELHRFGVTCPDLDTFVAALAGAAKPAGGGQ